MIIIKCPECETSYELEDGSIPLKGRKVRCTACKHVWLETPGDIGDLSKNPAVAGLRDVTRTEAKPKRSILNLFGWGSAIVVVILLIASPFILPESIKSQIPPVKTISDLFNQSMQKKKVLAITNSSVEWNGQEFKITADIFNASDIPAKSKNIKIIVINDKCKPPKIDKACILKEWEFQVGDKMVAPNGVLHVETKPYQEIDGMHNVLLSF